MLAPRCFRAECVFVSCCASVALAVLFGACTQVGDPTDDVEEDDQGAAGGTGGVAGAEGSGEGGQGADDGSGGAIGVGGAGEGGKGAGGVPGGGMTGGAGGVAATGGMAASVGGQSGLPVPPAPKDRTVPMFVALGQGGRRIVSCDDGHTWKSTCTTEGFGSGTCKINNDNGDHDEWSAQGLAYGDGWFASLWGWFGAGTTSAHILRSADGRNWEHVFGKPGKPQGTWGTGVAYGQGAFVIAAQRSATHRSANAGVTWHGFLHSTGAHRGCLPKHRWKIVADREDRWRARWQPLT